MSTDILTPFVLAQAVGVTASGFFAFGTMSASPFNLIPALERSVLSSATRAQILTSALQTTGKQAFLATALLGTVSYLVAFKLRPEGTTKLHRGVLLGGAGLPVIAVTHTLKIMVPVYKRLGGIATGKGETWELVMKAFYRHNDLRAVLFGGAYVAGLTGLAMTAAGR